MPDIDKAVEDIISKKWQLEGAQEDVARMKALIRPLVGYSWANYMERLILDYLVPPEDDYLPPQIEFRFEYPVKGESDGDEVASS